MADRSAVLKPFMNASKVRVHASLMSISFFFLMSVSNYESAAPYPGVVVEVETCCVCCRLRDDRHIEDMAAYTFRTG
jgi:hypothetical protein